MRPFCVVWLGGLGFLSTGCFPACDSWAGYDLSLRVVDAETSEPLTGADVRVDLPRGDESVLLGFEPWLPTDESGTFRLFLTVDASGGPCGQLLPALPSVELGDPPDLVVVQVRTSEEIGIAAVPIDASDVSVEHDIFGTIELPPIRVVMQPY